MYIDATPPTDYLYCVGTSVSRTAYSALFAVIGTKFGTASASTFNLPDFRGVFPRGFSDTSTDAYTDPDRTTRVAKYTGGLTGNAIGTY